MLKRTARWCWVPRWIGVKEPFYTEPCAPSPRRLVLPVAPPQRGNCRESSAYGPRPGTAERDSAHRRCANGSALSSIAIFPARKLTSATSMPESPFVETNLFGFFGPDFAWESPVATTLEDLPVRLPAQDTIGLTRIYDARHLQAEAQAGGGYSEARFFDDFGFALLPHESEVEDWDIDPSIAEMDQDVVRLYHPECESLIRSRLLPGRRIELYQGAPMRRGPGTPNPFYAAGVHQDYGLLPYDYQESIEAFATPEIAQWWRHRFEQDDVEGFMVIDLWRPVYSDGPLLHMPLAVCEPHSVRVEDCVPLSLLEFSPTGRPTNQLGLRRQPDQRWYYYPGMTRSELLAFKNFQFLKNDADQSVEACFHAAFEDPGAPSDAKERQSCEHRVSVFLLADGTAP